MKRQIEFYRPDDRPEFISQWWAERIRDLESVFAGGLPPDWVMYPEVQACGLVASHGAAFEAICQEMGLDSSRVTPTQAAHRYHLARVGYPWKGFTRLVEWGGGLGMTKWILHDDPYTAHVVVDLPVMLVLQQAGAPSGCVSAFDNHAPHTFVSGPVMMHRARYQAPGRPLEECDIFLGTFSVSECTPACHDFLIEKDWFGASKVLLAMEPDKNLFPEAYGLRERLLPLGFRETDCPWPGAIYLELDR